MVLIRRIPGLCYTYRYIIYSFTLILLVVVYCLVKLKMFCLNLHARENVNQVCSLFQSGTITGNLCSPLCLREEIQSVTCYSFRTTRRVRFRGEWKGTKIVFKAPKQTSPFHWYDNGKITYPTEKQFISTLKAVIKNKLNIDLPLSTIMRITKKNFNTKDSDIRTRHKEIDSISTLILDNEFLILSVLPGNDIFPRLIGTCGPYYATEYIEPVWMRSSLLALTDSETEWIQRLQISAQILELLKRLATEMHEPIHLCDVELEHFGFFEDESIRYVDLEHVYPKSIVNKMFRKMPCQENEDCDIYDCRGKCNTATKTCSHGVANDNYQVVCEKLFLGWRRSNTVIVPGLLMSQHTPSDLAAVLRECANPRHEIGGPRRSPEESVTKRMYELIVEIEQTVVSQISI
ncbi:hypothetical protein HHI36_019495 [Cryptolaemus montrouzieri]|uniref:FAM69 N-terminal domain-containing protein n=1 Tax=Cryptolaemus montrouzieri TaxID=559131 RepID=A0ABD2P3I4_9CUCU